MFLTKTAATQNEGALSYLRVRGLYFLAVVFVRSVVVPAQVAARLKKGYRAVI